MFDRPSTAAVRERNAAGTLAVVVGEWNVLPLGSRNVANCVRKARAKADDEPVRRTSMRLADTELTRSECERAKERTERTVAAVGANLALKVFELMAPALRATWRASRASSPLRGASA